MIGTVRNVQGERIAYTWTGDDASRVVVLGHGLTSDKDRPWSEALAAGLAEFGIPSVRIAFPGNGESEGAFEDATPTKEVEDLRAVFGALGERQIAYVGHSMGGAVGLLTAACDERVRALVSLAAITHPGPFVDRMFGHLQPGKDVMLEKAHCPLTQGFLDAMHELGSLTKHVHKVTVPWLMVHGTADDVVLVQDSRDMVAAASIRNEPVYVEIEGADHAFTGEWLDPLCATVLPWLRAAF